jgi:hypothetical protein
LLWGVPLSFLGCYIYSFDYNRPIRSLGRPVNRAFERHFLPVFATGGRRVESGWKTPCGKVRPFDEPTNGRVAANTPTAGTPHSASGGSRQSSGAPAHWRQEIWRSVGRWHFLSPKCEVNSKGTPHGFDKDLGEYRICLLQQVIVIAAPGPCYEPFGLEHETTVFVRQDLCTQEREHTL